MQLKDGDKVTIFDGKSYAEYQYHGTRVEGGQVFLQFSRNGGELQKLSAEKLKEIRVLVYVE